MCEDLRPGGMEGWEESFFLGFRTEEVGLCSFPAEVLSCARLQLLTDHFRVAEEVEQCCCALGEDW